MAMDMSLMAADLSLGRSNSEVSVTASRDQNNNNRATNSKKPQLSAEEKLFGHGAQLYGSPDTTQIDARHNLHNNLHHHHRLHHLSRLLPPDLHALEEYRKALEDERLKIRVFERELPFCMRLLDDAIEASREKLDDRLTCKLLTPAEEDDGIRRRDPLIVMTNSSSSAGIVCRDESSGGEAVPDQDISEAENGTRKRKLQKRASSGSDQFDEFAPTIFRDINLHEYTTIHSQQQLLSEIKHVPHASVTASRLASSDPHINGPPSASASLTDLASSHSSYKWQLAASTHDHITNRLTNHAHDPLLIQSTAIASQLGARIGDCTAMGDVSAAKDTLPMKEADRINENHSNGSATMANRGQSAVNDFTQLHHKDYYNNSNTQILIARPEPITMRVHDPNVEKSAAILAHRHHLQDSGSRDHVRKQTHDIDNITNPLINNNNRFKPAAITGNNGILNLQQQQQQQFSMGNSDYGGSSCGCKPNDKQDGCDGKIVQKSVKPELERFIQIDPPNVNACSINAGEAAAADYMSTSRAALTDDQMMMVRKSTAAGQSAAAIVAGPSSCSVSVMSNNNNNNNNNNGNNSSSSSIAMMQAVQRKPRRCWSPELHQRFLNALNHLGGCQATPKQIREMMNVEGLTNDEVKSHLQKFRLHMRRPHNMSLGSIQADNAVVEKGNTVGHHLVVFGSIWVPPTEQYQQQTQHQTNVHTHTINDIARTTSLMEHHRELHSSYTIGRQCDEVMNKSQLQMSTSNDSDANVVMGELKKVANVKLQLQCSDMCNNIDCQELEEKSLKSEGEELINMDIDGHDDDYKHNSMHKTRSNMDEEIKLRITCTNYGSHDQVINNAASRV